MKKLISNISKSVLQTIKESNKDIRKKDRRDFVSTCVQALNGYPEDTRIEMLDEISIQILDPSA
tara:strand:- start:72263 stop:72454 length:192 start_codon:yes stop_codon:yes gene_type:complete